MTSPPGKRSAGVSSLPGPSEACMCCGPSQSVHVQGLAACTGCRGGCYQCAPVQLAKGENAVLTWDLGEIFGASNPTSLPSPTTSSLSRTILMWPEAGLYSRLHIADAERAQGLKPGHTALPEVLVKSGKFGHGECRSARFKCVGNAMPGEVSSVMTCACCCMTVAAVWNISRLQSHAYLQSKPFHE